MHLNKIIKTAIIASFLVIPVQASAKHKLIKKASPYTVTKTINRLKKIVKSKGLTVFARIDHAAGAEKVGKKMLPTQLLIFGNPKAGTPLMKSNPTIGLDLPLKALAWRDKEGKVWLAYTAPDALKKRHHITDRDKIFAKITKALGKLTDAAVKPK